MQLLPVDVHVAPSEGPAWPPCVLYDFRSLARGGVQEAYARGARIPVEELHPLLCRQALRSGGHRFGLGRFDEAVGAWGARGSLFLVLALLSTQL